MATAFRLAVGVLLLHIFVHGKENATTETAKPKVLNPTLPKLVNKNITSTQDQISKDIENTNIENHQNDQGDPGQRQKRGYNFNGFLPFSPDYPTYPSRFDAGRPYDQEYALEQIHKRLSDIAAIVRQPTMPPIPPSTRYPIFLPHLFYIPSSNCGCSAGDKRPFQPNPTQPIPTKPTPSTPIQTKPPLPSKNITVPLRDPEIGDGVKPSFIESEEDFSRPISFDPIPPNDDIKRRPPPVEHGSVQGDVAPVNSIGSTALPPLINIDSSRYIPSLPNPDTPSICDRAIISCCHQVTITYNCFATQGCPDPSLYGNPCDNATILKVIDRLQKYYGPKAG